MKYVKTELNHKNTADPENVLFYKTNPTEDISATCIREKLNKNADTSEYLDKKVLEYIQANKIY